MNSISFHEEKPLHGVRVLDLSRLLPGPFATMALADMGALVDKLEDTGAGDYLRTMPPQHGGMNAAFHTLNRGKRSLQLDLKKPEARDAFLRLVSQYDVLVESFRPGVMARLGLGYDVLSRVNPMLIYCAITGYGQTGPHAARAGHDLNYCARAGLLAMTGPSDRSPQVPGFQVADIGGALYAVGAITAALYARTQTSRGRFLDIALSESAISFGLFGMLGAQAGFTFPRGEDALTGGIAPYNTYRTRDNAFIVIAALEPKFWKIFCDANAFEMRMDDIVPGAHQLARIAEVAALVATRTRDEWENFSAQYDCCVEVVRTPSELREDAQHQFRAVFNERFRDGDSWNEPRTPLATAAHASEAPKQGEHSLAILREAGFTDEEIAALVQQA